MVHDSLGTQRCLTVFICDALNKNPGVCSLSFLHLPSYNYPATMHGVDAHGHYSKSGVYSTVIWFCQAAIQGPASIQIRLFFEEIRYLRNTVFLLKSSRIWMRLQTTKSEVSTNRTDYREVINSVPTNVGNTSGIQRYTWHVTSSTRDVVTSSTRCENRDKKRQIHVQIPPSIHVQPRITERRQDRN